MSQLEHWLLRAPIEAMTQQARNSQKFIAKDMASISTAAKAMATAAAKQDSSAGGGGTGDKAKLTKSVAALIKEVQALKKKVSTSCGQRKREYVH
jgi:molybdenum-dependent DNA-binding transcriptional regulator ModE